jgi:hypothetical protein
LAGFRAASTGTAKGERITEPREKPDEMVAGAGAAVSKLSVSINFLQAFLAIILGNVVYFLLMPSLPPMARHHPMHLDLGMLIDFWLCLVAYGLIRTARRWR